MSICNYCRFQEIKRHAEENVMVVTVLHDEEYQLHGVNVYVHPKHIHVVDIPRSIKDGKRNKRKLYFAAWFMALPDHCCCD